MNLDSIISNRIRVETVNRFYPTIDYYINLYSHFYDFVLNHYDDYIIIDFSTVTNNPRQFVDIVSSHGNLTIPKLNNNEFNRC